MILRKCDVCGKMEEVGDDINQKPEEALISIKKNEEDWDFWTYNLCKDCTNKLVEWIAIGRNKNG